MNEQFVRTQMLLGEDAMAKLKQAHVAVVGLGGVGGYAAEALARSGIGQLTIVDHDTISISNLNRQIGALHSTVGQGKAEVLSARIKDIAPDCAVTPLPLCYSAETRESLFSLAPDFIIDAIDLVTHKLDLIVSATHRDTPIISALGTGNKLDAEKLTVTDISKTYNCPLAKIMRKELRARGIHHLPVVFSPEEKRNAQQVETPPDGRRSIPGSVVWVPACAGFLLAGEVILRITETKER